MTGDPTAKRRRRIMREFRIDEISAVDRPAQRGARAVLMKSEDAARKRQVLTARDGTGHQHAFEDSEDAQSGHTSSALADGRHEAHCHPWVRHRDGTIEIGQMMGHAHAAPGPAAKSYASKEERTDMTATKRDEAIRKASDIERRLDDLAKAHARDHRVDFHKAYQAVLESDVAGLLTAKQLQAHRTLRDRAAGPGECDRASARLTAGHAINSMMLASGCGDGDEPDEELRLLRALRDLADEVIGEAERADPPG